MKKFLAIVLTAVMVLSLAACGSTAEDVKKIAKEAGASDEDIEAAGKAVNDAVSQAGAAISDAVLESYGTVEKGKLIMATNANFPPYEFVDDGEKIVGIDAEIAELIANELGLELQIEDMEFSSVLTSVQTGKVDIGFSGLTVTEERLKNVNFTSTYAQGVQAIIVPEDSDIKSVDDLYGRKIGVQEATTGHIYCEDDFGAENVEAYAFGTMAVQALVQGKIDAVVIDNNPAKEFVKANPGLKLLDTAYTEEDYAAAVGKDKEVLLEAINAVLDEKIADGTVQAILDKYISAE